MDSLNVNNYGTVGQAYAASSASSTEQTSSSSKNTALDMSDFLKLMAAQFQSQSLDSNVDNTEYISELAQFSAIQAMTSMSQTFNREYASALIGMEATVKEVSPGGQVTTDSGVVTSATFDSSGNCKITIGNNDYDLSDVTSVTSPKESSSTAGTDSGTSEAKT